MPENHDTDPPDTEPQTPKTRSSQRIRALMDEQICTCLTGESIEALAARAACLVHGKEVEGLP